MELTDFQRSCEATLIAALSTMGRLLVERSVAPLRQSRVTRWIGGVKHEIYVSARVSGSLLMVYIYEDGAELSAAGNRTHSYERVDFKSLQELQDRFVADVVAVLDYV